MKPNYPPQDVSNLQPVPGFEPGVYVSQHAFAEGPVTDAEVAAELALGKSAVVGTVTGTVSAEKYGIQATDAQKAEFAALAQAAEAAHNIVDPFNLVGGEDGDEDGDEGYRRGSKLVGAGRRF